MRRTALISSRKEKYKEEEKNKINFKNLSRFVLKIIKFFTYISISKMKSISTIPQKKLEL